MKTINDYKHCCDDCLRYEECRMKDEKLNQYLRVSDLIHGCDHFIDKNDKYWVARYEEEKSGETLY